MKTSARTFFPILCLHLFIFQYSHAQSPVLRTRFDGIFGVSLDAYCMSKTTGLINGKPVGIALGGLEMDVEYSDHSALGGGIWYKQYAFSANHAETYTPGNSEPMRSLTLPFYYRRRSYFKNRDATAFALAGAALGINLDYHKQFPAEETIQIIDGSEVAITTTVDGGLKRAFPLALVGAGIEGRILERYRGASIRIGLSVRRYVGLMEALRSRTVYSINGFDTITAKGKHFGGYWMFGFHLAVAFER